MALATSTLLAYPNPRLPFIVEPDASDYQLASIISQHNSLSSINTIIKILLETSTSKKPLGFRPIAFFVENYPLLNEITPRWKKSYSASS